MRVFVRIGMLVTVVLFTTSTWAGVDMGGGSTAKVPRESSGGSPMSGGSSSLSERAKPILEDDTCDTALTPELALEAVLAERTGGAGALPGSQKDKANQPPPPPPPEITEEDIRQQLAAELDSQSNLQRAILSDEVKPINVSSAKSALTQLHTFFSDLSKIFFEREELMDLLKLTVSSDSAMLIMGPGGTGKSDVVDRLGENLIDDKGDASYFQLQLTHDTTMSETMGGLVAEKMLKGEVERKWEEGVLGSAVVFLDEFFDGRLKFLRSFLKAFNERKYTQGKTVFYGVTRVFVAATNKYLNQIYEAAGNNDPQALIDRFQFSYYTPGVLQKTESIFGLFRTRPKFTAKLKYSELDKIQEVAAQIPIPMLQQLRMHYIFSSMRKKLKEEQDRSLTEFIKARNLGQRTQPPYYSTRLFSPRSLRIAGGLVRVEALLATDLAQNNSVAVTSDNVDQLMAKFVKMQGPEASVVERLIADETNPYELSQLNTLKVESEALDQVMTALRSEEQKFTQKFEAILSRVTSAKDPQKKLKAKQELVSFVAELIQISQDVEQAEDITAQQVAALFVLKGRLTEPVLVALQKK
jgi:MoxR-like ATPase